MSNDPDELTRLREENARLIALLESHDIDWQPRAAATSPAPALSDESGLSTDKKVALFRRLFRGRNDVYALRWESTRSGKSGYAPACANEWRPGICEKPRIKCADCDHRRFLPVTDAVVYDHLAGRHTIGVYPLLSDDTCHFLAVDFDKDGWQDDARAFAASCRELSVPVGLEISRSGNGAHAWIFFESNIMARDARRLGSAVISHACARTRQLGLDSYDRLFPNQDTLPMGGFGNLIALPLQKSPRELGRSVFVDDDLRPYPDQWGYLASVEPMMAEAVEAAVLSATGGSHPLDVTFVDEEALAEPWKRDSMRVRVIHGPLPDSLTVTLADRLYFEKAELPQPLANRLVRLAAFQNPEFYRAQAMRLSVWNKPRVICCAENFPRHIALPRGCLEAATALFSDLGIRCELRDERFGGTRIDVSFTGSLRPDQDEAVAGMLNHDTGVLAAPTAFGKTVTAAALIARRGVNTLVLVHRTELLRQWQERLRSFLGLGKEALGTIGGGRNKPTGVVDIAVMQSLARKGEVDSRVEDYGQVIVDECHHVGAVSFEAIMRRVRARNVHGLTATPIRRDGQQPIIFMQCGPVRHTAVRPPNAPHDLEVIPRLIRETLTFPDDAGIQAVFRALAADDARTEAIVTEIELALGEGRKLLVLTERTDHLERLQSVLERSNPMPFILHGRMSRRQRSDLVEQLDQLPADAPRVLLATGRLVGEGFDHPPLDTLILAMPVSWKGTLQQYAGRLHRDHATKSAVRIIDFVDTGHPALLRMWEKRRRGYLAMGYRVAEPRD